MPGTVNAVNTGNDLLMRFFNEKVPVLICSLSDQLLFFQLECSFLKEVYCGEVVRMRARGHQTTVGRHSSTGTM